MSGDFSLEADITVNNQASDVFDSIGQSAQQTQDALGNLGGAVSDGSGSWEDHRDAVNSAWKEYRFANKEFQVNNQLAFEGTRLIGSVGHAALKLTHIFTAYNTLQTNIGDAEENLNDKREKAVEAIARYGANSKQAVKALKDQQKAQEKLDRTNQGAIAQYIGMSVAVGSLATDAFRVSKEFSVLRRTIGARGGISGLLGLGGGAADLASGIAPLANSRGSSLLTKGNLLKGAGIVAGTGLIVNGVMSGGQGKDINERLGSVAQTALGGLTTGAIIGSVVPGIGTAIGAGVGGAAGLAVGLAQNFGEELGNFFGGKGFVSNSDLSNGGMTVNGDVNVYPQGATANEVIQHVNSTIRKRSAVAGPVG